MKRFYAFIIVAALSVSCYSQREVTKFMDIPVDGTKKEMMKNLKKKGFEYNSVLKCMQGEFNGHSVDIYIVTHNKKVWRIVVKDAYFLNAADIKIRFNQLCSQFEKNPNYVSYKDNNQTIPVEEDISDEIKMNSKEYQATYFQHPTNITEGKPSISVWQYTENLHKRVVWFRICEDTYGKVIYGTSAGYYICMYYDNEYNNAHGEDL